MCIRDRYETQEWKDFCNYMYQWNQEGLLMPDGPAKAAFWGSRSRRRRPEFHCGDTKTPASFGSQEKESSRKLKSPGCKESSIWA